MNVVLCGDAAWLLSEEAFLIYASCMYRPTYENFKMQMEDLLNDPSVRIFVCENQGEKAGMMVLKYSNAVAEIIGIAVPEKLHRRGIGRNMHRIQPLGESWRKTLLFRKDCKGTRFTKMAKFMTCACMES